METRQTIGIGYLAHDHANSGQLRQCPEIIDATNDAQGKLTYIIHLTAMKEIKKGYWFHIRSIVRL